MVAPDPLLLRPSAGAGDLLALVLAGCAALGLAAHRLERARRRRPPLARRGGFR